MRPIVGLIVVPLAILAFGIGMALSLGDPLWLVYSALLAMAAGYITRRTFGS